jgi:hypothetical protein
MMTSTAGAAPVLQAAGHLEAYGGQMCGAEQMKCHSVNNDVYRWGSAGPASSTKTNDL